MYNSAAQEHMQGSTHTMGLILPREADVDNTDMEIAEIINGTLGDSLRNHKHDEREDSSDTFFDALYKPKGDKEFPVQKSQMKSTQAAETL